MEADRLGLRQGVKGVIVVADSNFLMMMASGMVTPTDLLDALLSSHVIVTPSEVVAELERLSRHHPKRSTRRLAERALWLIKRLGVEVVKGVEAGDADDAVEKLASRLRGAGARVIVATSDRALRGRLRKRGIPTLYYRESEGRLEAEWVPDL